MPLAGYSREKEEQDKEEEEEGEDRLEKSSSSRSSKSSKSKNEKSKSESVKNRLEVLSNSSPRFVMLRFLSTPYLTSCIAHVLLVLILFRFPLNRTMLSEW